MSYDPQKGKVAGWSIIPIEDLATEYVLLTNGKGPNELNNTEFSTSWPILQKMLGRCGDEVY